MVVSTSAQTMQHCCEPEVENVSLHLSMCEAKAELSLLMSLCLPQIQAVAWKANSSRKLTCTRGCEMSLILALHQVLGNRA